MENLLLDTPTYTVFNQFSVNATQAKIANANPARVAIIISSDSSVKIYVSNSKANAASSIAIQVPPTQLPLMISKALYGDLACQELWFAPASGNQSVNVVEVIRSDKLVPVQNLT